MEDGDEAVGQGAQCLVVQVAGGAAVVVGGEPSWWRRHLTGDKAVSTDPGRFKSWLRQTPSSPYRCQILDDL